MCNVLTTIPRHKGVITDEDVHVDVSKVNENLTINLSCRIRNVDNGSENLSYNITWCL